MLPRIRELLDFLEGVGEYEEYDSTTVSNYCLKIPPQYEDEMQELMALLIFTGPFKKDGDGDLVWVGPNHGIVHDLMTIRHPDFWKLYVHDLLDALEGGENDNS